jgi:UDP-N-acetylglucosamine 2-epimerase (non-hydrolysing)
MAKRRIVCVVGTRPEAIKVAPVVLELRRYWQFFETVLVSTGQHREMLTQALKAFGLAPDQDLQIMRHGQSLAEVTARAMQGLDELFRDLAPNLVVAQGDTTTTFVSALASFYRQIPFAHVEAGLRTDTIDNPFPEEFNRRAAGLVAGIHLAPTRWAAENLFREGKDPQSIFITGNTGIDAVQLAAESVQDEWFPEHKGRVVLLTTHRRENWGEPQGRIASAALEVTKAFEDVLLVVPMHKNPQVRETLTAILGKHPRIRLIEPPDYAPFVKLMQRSTIILSDSGGVQEEAPAFGIPVLVLRETTERPEGVDAGTAKLVGTDRERIIAEATELLGSPTSYEQMAKAVSPYGDGKAALRIRYIVAKELGVATPQEPMWT